MKSKQELAWAVYCADTAGSMDVRDFWEDLTPDIQAQYLKRVEITENDLLTVRYFIKEKGDVTRWVWWSVKKPVFAELYPELVAALAAVSNAERNLQLVLDSLKLPE